MATNQAQAQVDALNAANLERVPQFKKLLIDAGHVWVDGHHRAKGATVLTGAQLIVVALRGSP